VRAIFLATFSLSVVFRQYSDVFAHNFITSCYLYDTA